MDYNKILFVIIEPHMISSLQGLIRLCEKNLVDYYLFELPFKPLQKKERIFKGNPYLKTIKKLTGMIPENYLKDTVVIYSCAEGFEFSNKNIWMPELYNCREVCIMHGFTRTIINRYQELFRKTINFFSFRFLGFNLLGFGFGATVLDYIIVYSIQNKDFLINNFEWNPKGIIISGRLLKYSLIDSNTNKLEKKEKKCILLLQDLVSAGFISDSNYQYILSWIIDEISDYFDKIIIRRHPKMEEDDLSLLIDKNKVFFSENSNIEEDLNDNIDLAVSFFSTALIEASLFNIPIMAIKIKQISDKEYVRFSKVIELGRIKEELSKGITLDYRINPEYFDCSDNTEESFEKLLYKN